MKAALILLIMMLCKPALAAEVDLYAGGKGMNCAVGYHLEDVDACEAYANDNIIDFKGTTASSDRPKGCYAQHTKAGARVGVYFNEATAPKRNVWGRTRPICKGKWSFTPEFKFVEAYEGRNCAPGKFVATSSDCAAAADEMGLALRGEIKSMKRPAGCYVDSRNKVYFNTRLVAYQGGRYGRRGTGICGGQTLSCPYEVSDADNEFKTKTKVYVDADNGNADEDSVQKAADLGDITCMRTSQVTDMA